MKSVIAKGAWLNENDKRLDASYHLSKGRTSKVLIEKSPKGFQLLKDVTLDIFNGARFKRYYVQDIDRGIPFMGSTDMLKSDFNNLKLISKKHSKNINALMLERDWILVSCSGTIGNTSYTNNEFIQKSASQHIMRIIPNPKKILSGYLYAFLCSKYGYALLTQGTYGAVIQHIEPQHSREIPVPICFEELQKKIHKLIIETGELREKANNTINGVLNKLEKGFVIDRKEKSFVLNIKNVKSGDLFTKELRLESDFYQPSINNVIDNIKSDGKWDYIGNIAKNINRSGLRERKFVKKGIPLITGQSLNQYRLDDLKFLSKKFTKNIDKNITNKDDILISVQGTIGKIEYAHNNIYENVFASEQLCKLKIDSSKLHPGYVYAFLLSKLGKVQLLKHKTGSVIEWIRENNIASIVIPIPKDNGLKMGTIINEAIELRHKAYLKESEAINLIESEIESWQN